MVAARTRSFRTFRISYRSRQKPTVRNIPTTERIVLHVSPEAVLTPTTGSRFHITIFHRTR